MGDDIVFLRVAGMDISKSDVKVCVRTSQAGSSRPSTRTKTFGSTLAECRRMRAWLEEWDIERVVMESTSAYWKPYWNVLEGAPFEVIVSNAHMVKQIRGRKTDMSDAAWLAKLGAMDSAPTSFIPPREIRDLRLATRVRAKWVSRATSAAASLEKLLEDTGCKLSDASSKLLTVSGRAILEAICGGCTDPGELAKHSKLRNTTGDDLLEALEAQIRPVHIPLIRAHLDLIDYLQAAVCGLDAQIAALALPFEPQIRLLCTIPGVDRVLAYAIVAETGTDMGVFCKPANLAAWAGVAPGSHQSAKVSHAERVRKGNRHLKAALGQAARSAVNTRDTFLRARFLRIRSRRGAAKAYTAVAHSISNAIWAMLSRNVTYTDLGADYYTRTATTAQKRRLQAHAETTLQRLGIPYTINQPAA